MATRRDKQRPPKPQHDTPTEAAGEHKKPKESSWKEKLSDYLLDVSKYILTGVVITSLFSDVTNKVIIYIIGLAAVFSTLWLGLILAKNNRKE